MATLGQAVRALEEQLFVGRSGELASFQHWLNAGAASPPEVLNVFGPGGIGKTALLSAFQREAKLAGRQVLLVDARTFSSAPGELLDALGGGSLDSVIARLNANRPLLLLDTVEETGGRDLLLRQRFLARLEADVRVVVASRSSLARVWAKDDLWHQLMRPLPLGGLPRANAREYLLRRGLTSHEPVFEQILAVTRGYPLGLSLAADLVVRLRLASIDAAPEWRLAVRALVERLVDTEDPHVRELLEAAALLRQFDEATLLAVVGSTGSRLAPFAQLCDLSVVQPTLHGLELHEDVRRILVEDLRWRDPDRYETLRTRAAAHYRERSQRAPAAERARLICDWLFLSNLHTLRTALFEEEHNAVVYVESGHANEQASLNRAWRTWIGESGTPCEDALDPLPECTGARIRVARDQHGDVVGFGAFVPVSQATLPLLQRHAGFAGMLRAFLDSGAAHVPSNIESSRIFCHTQVARSGASSAPTLAALLRDSFELLVQGGVHLARCSSPQQHAALESLGFEALVSVGGCRRAGGAVQGYVLDLSRTGVDTWVAAITLGRRPPRTLAAAEFERELRDILPHWLDDDYLSHSPLWECGALATASPERSASKLRELIGGTLTRLAAPADADHHLAYRAVELAYLTPRLSNEAAAERLAVSRATFYRLIKRGIRGLALALGLI
jgi:AAA ATPase domain